MLQTYIEKMYKTEYLTTDVFNILGGHDFNYKALDNSIIPTFQIRANKIKFEEFGKYTRFNITRIVEKNTQEALINTQDMLVNNKWQLVFVNCFYLPYDLGNYKVNIDNHMIIITGYNPVQDNYRVIDPKYGEEILKSSDLILARKNTLQKTLQYLSIEQNDSKNYLTLSPQNTISLIKKNNMEYLSEGFQKLKSFKKNIHAIDELEGIYKKIALQNLSKAIRHPHGPITIRLLMSKNFEKKEENLNLLYKRLSKKWFSFANILIRLKQDNVNINTLISCYDEIIELEQLAANSIRMIKEDQYA